MPAIYPIHNDHSQSSCRDSQKRIINEEEIIIASKQDPSNFKAIYEHYFNAILNYVNHRVNEPNTASDITSSVFLKALTNLKNYKVTGVPFSAWLYKIAYNETMIFFRKTKNFRHVTLDDQLIENLKEDMPTIDKEHLIRSTMHVLDSLEHNDAELIDLKYFQKKSGKEIAYILNISEANVKVKTHRLLKRIKKMTEQEHGKI